MYSTYLVLSFQLQVMLRSHFLFAESFWCCFEKSLSDVRVKLRSKLSNLDGQYTQYTVQLYTKLNTTSDNFRDKNIDLYEY